MSKLAEGDHQKDEKDTKSLAVICGVGHGHVSWLPSIKHPIIFIVCFYLAVGQEVSLNTSKLPTPFQLGPRPVSILHHLDLCELDFM